MPIVTDETCRAVTAKTTAEPRPARRQTLRLREDGESSDYPDIIESQATRTIGWLLMSPIIIWSVTQVYINIYEVVGNGEFTAFDCARMANDLCGTTLNLLVVLLWHTFTSKSPGVHKFWRLRTWFLPTGFMPGGFAPRPAAFSVGVLLFVSGSLVKEDVVTGDEMMDRMTWRAGEQCRANSVDVRHPETTWFGRFHRGFPGGCFYGGPDPRASIAPHMFTREELETAIATDNETWVRHPRIQRTVDPDRVPIVSDALKALNISWLHQSDNFYRSSDTEDALDCMYNCVWWENWGVNMIVNKLGVILSGAFVVVQATDSLSSFVGVRMVTEHTAPKELSRLFEKMSNPSRCLRCFQRNSGICAIQLVILRGVMAWLAPKFDRDGFFTVDYYVSTVLTISVLTAVMLRIWNPYLMSPVVYTSTLWTEGEDTFICADDSDNSFGKRRKKKIDLYEWIHMPLEERVRLLILYARRVSSDPADFEDARDSAEGPTAVMNLTEFTVEKSHEEDVLLPVKGRLVPRRIIWKRRVTVAEGARGHALKLAKGLVTVRWAPDPKLVIEHDLDVEDAQLFAQEDREDAYDTEVDPLTLAEESTPDNDWDILEKSWLGDRSAKPDRSKPLLPR